MYEWIIKRNDYKHSLIGFKLREGTEIADLSKLRLNCDGSEANLDRYLSTFNVRTWEADNLPNGDLCLTGRTSSDDNALWVYKISAQGELLFNKTFSRPGRIRARAVAMGLDGSCVFAAWANGISDDLYYGRINNAGETLWEKILDLGGDDQIEGMISTSDGNYIILGETSVNKWCLFSVKVDQNGNMLWTKFYNPEGTWYYVVYNGFELEDEGLVYSALVRRSSGDSFHSLRLFKTDSNGELLWSTHISTNTHTYSSSTLGNPIVELCDHNVLFAGMKTARSKLSDTALFLGLLNAEGEWIGEYVFDKAGGVYNGLARTFDCGFVLIHYMADYETWYLK